MLDKTQIYFTLIRLSVISFTDVLGSTTNEAESLDIGSILGMAEMQGGWNSDQRDRPTFNAGLLTYKKGKPYTERSSPSSGGHSCCYAQSPYSSYSARTCQYKDEPLKSTYDHVQGVVEYPIS